MAATRTASAPATEDDVRDAVAAALDSGTPLEIVGGASKRGLGRPPADGMARLDLAGLTGVTLYEPEELVLGAQAATPLAEVATLLAENGQMLAFEPPDWSRLLGTKPGTATIGGTLAANLSGPRRVKAGAARDHFLGLRAVSGRGELFKAGGRVVKNVTGYDLCKLFAGSWGTLGAMTHVTLKVLPVPEDTATVALAGLDDSAAVRAMTAALNSPNEVSGAAHLPAPVAAQSAVAAIGGAGGAVTLLRLEGPGPSVAARAAALTETLAPFGSASTLGRDDSVALWRDIAGVAAFASDAPPGSDRVVWRLSVPPSAGAAVVERIAGGADCRAYFDWGGGLIWLAMAPDEDGGAVAVRDAVAGAGGGHALLVRGDAALRARVPVFQPLEGGVEALTRRLKEAFDPAGILNPCRMHDGV